ncbi:pilus assembly protein [Comamonas guangdongensis]|uniref:Pilus assembly protein n=1 Tax=Comamonas guangdongensis TaxID=510515 RepID=A0ABV3ZQD4_9BURK
MSHRIKSYFPRTALARLAWLALPLVGLVSFWASSSGTPPAFKAVDLAREPLYAAVTVDKPTLALALSVEFPTVGAQYRDSYSNTNEYIGYYDAESCYTYNNAPTETPVSGLSSTDYKRFDRSGAASNRMCSDAFSGNFLNWVSNSAIDMLRLALSGGDRYIDQDGLTILQRAVLPNGGATPADFWNDGSYFPDKTLSRSGGGAGNYWGAIPLAMRTAAGTNDIHVANTLNRIYFRAGSATGNSSTGPASYTLSSSPSSAIGAIVNSNNWGNTKNDLPGTAVSCASNNAACAFTGVKEIWYGGSTGSGGSAKYYWRHGPVYSRDGTGVTCSTANLGTPSSVSGPKCYISDYAGSWTPPQGSGDLNTDGFFYSRVQVCASSGGALQDVRDYGLCRQYPNGKYKPTGVIQKYSDQLRLAAFGYLMDQTQSSSNGRYGGVLRAPMKYVGGKTFDEFGRDNTSSTGNSKIEWDANTGVFKTNPEGDAMGVSGVINYLNKFGRTGATPGMYKQYDPVGELHYEALRYLQGLQPSTSAVSGINDVMKDGFPVYTSWTDPYGGARTNASDYSCIKSNVVVIGDKNTWDGNRLPTASAANNIPDINYWRSIVGKYEANTGGTYVDGQGVTQTISNPNTANGSINSVITNTGRSQIIGSAYWAHMRDIRGTDWKDSSGAPNSLQRPGLRVKTFIFDVNEGSASSDYATRSTSNQLFIAAKYGGFESDPTNTGAKPYNTKGNPFKRDDGTNDDNVWKKSAAPGDAQTYYLQSDARGVLSAFDAIFGRASTAARSIAGGAAASSSVSSGTTLYTARFDTSNWSGDVVAESLSVDAASKAVTLGAQVWSAANKLDTRTSAASGRNIVVGREGSTANPAATNFAWGSIDAALQANLNKAAPAATPDNRGQDRLNYIRGDRSLEGNPFRVRTSLMGDVVNSNVVYSGGPGLMYAGTGYAAFRSQYGGRAKVVFAGANDGMLHAFNADTGVELFGYIPSWLGPKLSALTDPTFASTHQNYVDAPLALGDAQVASNDVAADWKTVLAGGTGGGGAGVFALDVSDPSSFDASKVLWEFKRADDPDMGQVVGQPRILKFKTSGSGTGAPTYRWFVVVASGVNNYVLDGAGLFSASGKPALFLLALDKPVGTAWSLGDNYYKISLPVDATLAATVAPGLVNFTPLYGSAGEVTDVYAGDMHGKLWKLSNFNSVLPANWSVDSLSFFNKGTASSPSPYPLYAAKTSSGDVQPITVAPTLFSGPIVAGIETFYVAFGTGKYLESADNNSTLTNSFYTLYDNGSAIADASPVGDGAISGRGRLIAGTVDTTAKTIALSAFKWGRPLSNTDASMRSGWYIDLPSSGEKMVSSIADFGVGSAAFNTVIPGASGSSPGSCSAAAGGGNQYAFNIFTGKGTYVPSLVGIPGPAIFFVNASETTETKSDSTGRRIRSTVQRGVTVGQSGVSGGGQNVTVNEVVGRLEWRQIFNYQDMKNK